MHPTSVLVQIFAAGKVSRGSLCLQLGYSSPSQEGIMRDLHISLAEVLMQIVVLFVHLDGGDVTGKHNKLTK